MGLHLHLLQAQLLVSILLIFVSRSISTQSNFQIAEPNCTDHCGNVSIPFPFGTREGCYFNISFSVSCNDTHYDPPKPFWVDSRINITSISLEGQLYVLQSIAKDCYSRDGTSVDYYEPWITLIDGFVVNNTANKFFVVGCDSYAYVSGSLNNRSYLTGCFSTCNDLGDLVDSSCLGVGCCQISILKLSWKVELTLHSFNNLTTVSDFNNCSYGFLAEESAFTFSESSLFYLRNVEKLPMVVDWTVGEGTCEEARNNDGYDGNPYLNDGCSLWFTTKLYGIPLAINSIPAILLIFASTSISTHESATENFPLQSPTALIIVEIYFTGCNSWCETPNDLGDGSCSGLGCCQTSIPKEVWRVNVSLTSYESHTNVWEFNNCSYAFLVEESYFSFSPSKLSRLMHVDKLPIVVDWTIGIGSCEEAQTNMSSYACKSLNSECYKPDNGYGIAVIARVVIKEIRTSLMVIKLCLALIFLCHIESKSPGRWMVE
ncbi:unnamed protein product [Fraxinus pennsylvanica]|uniref:Wall-associated receptor kinase galacturonan-binding domain-containing protein n=1 Tax=Fraxinus pennsylvanica TaxID=56036 RepID=A0AAD2A406_9LAMI|nr:unnamed protein product [Fraxinus pennsylvanica]